MQLVPSIGWVTNVYADLSKPSIYDIAIEQVVGVEEGDKTYSYSVIFNGFNVREITNIQVKRFGSSSVVRNIPISRLKVIDDATLVAEDIGTLTGFFGDVLNQNIYLIPVYKDETGKSAEGTSNVMIIPSENLPDINRIYDGTQWVNPPSWPANILKKADNKFILEGDNFDNLSGYSIFIQGAGSASKISNYHIKSATEIEIDTNQDSVPIGRNMRLIFEKSASNVTIRYRLENAINIIRPLDLGDENLIDISPLEGTQGTLVRIKVDKHEELINPQTKVYIGGVEAKRNIVEEEGRDGTFNYDENKKGLEVIVPELTAGFKQIIIQNYLGDTYIHDELFEYFDAGHPRLNVKSAIPVSGPVGRKNDVSINIDNAIAIHGLKDVNKNSHVTVRIVTNKNELKYSPFKNEANEKENLLFLQYDLGDGRYIERKITLTIGLPAEIKGISNIPTEEKLLSDLPVTTDISATTAAVGTPGKVVIRVRTETVLIDSSGNEIEYVVEQAPYVTTDAKYYEFIADETTPIINNIIPNQGAYDKNIVVTIEGQNFDVRHIDGKTYYPTVIIGKNGRYKVINNEGMFYSTTSDGNYDVANKYDDTNAIAMTVLDQNGNIVDGQIRKKGTRIKLTIPGDSIRDYYTGAADVLVRNPTALGELGSIGIRENFFEYLPKAEIDPVIETVLPDKVAVGSREKVTITGRNFQPNLIVSVDGEIVQNPIINPAAGTIQFNAPDGRPGKTFIQLINPATGGMASHPFEFIRTYSTPRIDRIIPNSAGEGSLVIIKGNGFYKADHLGETEEFKIGSKILIDGKDVNKEYISTEGDPQAFKHPITGEEIKDKNGNNILTYGSNIAVIDDKTIYMIVPDPKDSTKPFFMNEWLDVEVVNPDLGKYTLARGFRFIDVAKKPQIHSISPVLGDYRGGNIVQIDGRDFAEGIKVYFGTEEAQVYRRSNIGQTLWVYVPPYPDNLQDNNRATVPVTVMNPDSGSDTKYDGYTYVNPGYTPKITKLNPNLGNTAGGTRVLISGENFRTVVGSVYDENQWKPDVYFGGIKVKPEDVTFVLAPNDTGEGTKTSDLIVVENTPPNLPGRVDVTVINYDGATATLKDGYEYVSRRPVISQILPSQGSILGGTEITIIGRDFVENGLHVVFGEEVGEQDILSGRATVRLGDIIVTYNAFSTDDHVQVYYKVENDDNLIDSFKLPDEEFKIFDIDWNEIAQKTGETDKEQWFNEKVKVELQGTNLKVTRRLGTIQRVEGTERIIVKIPPAAATGRTRLTVYNHDGTNVSGDFTYTSPYRPPVIDEIIPTEDVRVVDVEGIPEDISLATAPPKGGSPLIITGKNFRAGVKVYIGDKEAEIRSKSPNDDELIITVPPADTGKVGPYLRIMVVNEDGGIGYGDQVPKDSNRRPYYFQYIVEGSNPTISLLDPEKGPVSGGTKIIIKGNEFKDEDSLGGKKDVRVFIGGIPVPQSDVKYIDYNNLEVIAPRGKVGTQTVEVVNYDHGRAIGVDGFTYISEPEITSVNPTRLFSNDTETEVTITGKMFQPGAKVVLGGKVIKEDADRGDLTLHGTGIRGVDSEGNNNNVAVIGGVQAVSVTVESSEVIKVKFPEAFDLESSSLIIINPDGGISKEYDDFKHEIPIPTKPLVLEAIPGYESTIQLVWSDSSPEVLNAADKYEVYAKLSSDRNYTFIGDTTDAEFLIKGLEPNTRYDFMVRALNRYGSALEFAEVSARTLTLREDDKLKDKQEELDKIADQLKREGKEEIIDGALVKTIGTEQISSGGGFYTIDFSLSKYKGRDKFIVAIPVSILNTLNRNIMITDGNANFTFHPRSLYTREAIEGLRTNPEDAHVRVVFERVTGQEATRLQTAIPRTKQKASAIYGVDFQLQVGRNITDMRQILQPGSLAINFDSRSYPNARRGRLNIAKYDISSHQFKTAGTGNFTNAQSKSQFILLSDR